MAPKKKIETILNGGKCKQVPFTMYECMIPQCEAERELRNRGCCVINRRTGDYEEIRPNCPEHEKSVFKNGNQHITKHIETPEGPLTVGYEVGENGSWTKEKMFKSPEDYKKIMAYFKDMNFKENYAAFAQAQKYSGEDVLHVSSSDYEPLQYFISSEVMDMQDFCMEWMDHQDEILKICDVIKEKQRDLFKILAESPAQLIYYGGNYVTDILGAENIEKYYLPSYQECAEAIHKKGKLLGSHYDANCKLVAPYIAKSGLDIIEAFTPAPDTDMTLKEARDAWPDKILWLNFPSSVHLQPDKAVEEKTVDLLNELDSTEGIIMGITEDMPPDRWRDSCRAIMTGLERHAKEFPEKY